MNQSERRSIGSMRISEGSSAYCSYTYLQVAVCCPCGAWLELEHGTICVRANDLQNHLVQCASNN